MHVKQAMEIILEHSDNPVLNYAIRYTEAGLTMEEDTEEFKVQCMYIVNNIAGWRASSHYNITKETIKEVCQTIKDVTE